MTVTHLFLLTVVAPVAFFMVIWAAVTACRLWLPKRVLAMDAEVFMARWEHSGGDVPVVGVEQIHEAHRRREQKRQREAPLRYLPHEPASRLPDEWVDGLWARRN